MQIDYTLFLIYASIFILNLLTSKYRFFFLHEYESDSVEKFLPLSLQMNRRLNLQLKNKKICLEKLRYFKIFEDVFV